MRSDKYLGVWVTAAVATFVWSQSTSAVFQAAASSAPAQNVTAGAIANNPEKFYGQKVTVRAEVEDVLSPYAFLLDEEKLFAWPDVLVITPQLMGVLPEDQVVTVTGTVRRFNDAELRRDYAWNWWNGWDADMEGTFRDRPVIMADSVTGTAGNEYVKGK